MRRWLPWLVLGSLVLLSRKFAVSQPPPTERSKRRATPEERAAIVGELAALGWPAREVVTAINIESGWRSDALNPDGLASGLIQFMPKTLKALGFRPDLPPAARAAELRKLSPLQQLPWIRRYFATKPRWQVPGDTYLALAAPAFIGRSDSAVAYKVGSAAWKSNPALRSPGGGDITAGSIRALLLRRMGTPAA